MVMHDSEKEKKESMKFFKTRLGTIIVTALVCAIVFSGIAVAATYPKSISGSGNVVAGNPDIAFFSDAACTTPLDSIVMPEIVQGEQGTSVTFYVKNVGNKNFSSVAFSHDLAAGVGTLSPFANNFPLTKGQSVGTSVILNTAGGTVTGAYSFTATYTGTY